MKIHCRFAPNAGADKNDARGGGARAQKNRKEKGGGRAGSDRGVLTVEASLVMTGTILMIFAVIMLSMVLRSHAAAVSDVRLGVQREYSDFIEEGIPGKISSASASKEEIPLWPLGSVSYEEEASRVFYNLPQLMRIGRIFG